MKTYCRDETDPLALSRVTEFVADYEIGEMEKRCSGKDGLIWVGYSIRFFYVGVNK